MSTLLCLLHWGGEELTEKENCHLTTQECLGQYEVTPVSPTSESFFMSRDSGESLQKLEGSERRQKRPFSSNPWPPGIKTPGQHQSNLGGTL